MVHADENATTNESTAAFLTLGPIISFPLCNVFSKVTQLKHRTFGVRELYVGEESEHQFF